VCGTTRRAVGKGEPVAGAHGAGKGGEKEDQSKKLSSFGERGLAKRKEGKRIDGPTCGHRL